MTTGIFLKLVHLLKLDNFEEANSFADIFKQNIIGNQYNTMTQVKNTDISSTNINEEAEIQKAWHTLSYLPLSG